MYRYAGMVITIANICIILILLTIYWKNYLKWRSQYTIGLLVFGTFLLVQNIISMGTLAPPPPPPPSEAIISPLYHEIPLLLISICQLVSLATLLKISWK